MTSGAQYQPIYPGAATTAPAMSGSGGAGPLQQRERLPMDPPAGNPANPQSSGNDRPHSDGTHPLWLDATFWRGRPHAPELLGTSSSDTPLEHLQPFIAPFTLLGASQQPHQAIPQHSSRTSRNAPPSSDSERQQPSFTTRARAHALHSDSTTADADPEDSSRPWDPDEDTRILQLVDEFEEGSRAELSLRIIANEIGRTLSATKARWHNKLKTEWEQTRETVFDGFSAP